MHAINTALLAAARRYLRVALPVAIATFLFVPAAQADQTPGADAWSKIESVLHHPRCMNCHQATSPLQGDDGHAHSPTVARGADGTGAGSMHCAMCHKPSGNDPMTGAPGAKDWRLAPTTMIWQSKSSAELCALLKDPKSNGDRNGAQLIAHMDVEPLVLWGWAPGDKRAPVPLGHKEFITAMRAWVAGGMPCPK